ncbi:MAG: hypothetical protein ACK5JD_01820 [Mangrovibacterium sp.]
MNKKLLLAMVTLCLFGLNFSCQDELATENQSNKTNSTETQSSVVLSTKGVLNPAEFAKLLEQAKTQSSPLQLPQQAGQYDFDFELSAVDSSTCSSTPFNVVTNKYNNLLVYSVLPYLTKEEEIGLLFDDYFIINQIAALEGVNADYFGENGQYTAYLRSQTRSLEKFWEMPGLISVRGQHTATLEDLDYIRYVYENYSDFTAEEIDMYVAMATYFNEVSDQVPENPFYASDGFSSSSGIIVIGDGIIQMMAEVGLQPELVWSAVLVHEWAHQIQFLNYELWTDYPVPAFDDTPESTRMTELEADFFTGYYLTHKRGGAFNWKRIEEVLINFYNIGDCGFTSPGHHGTPTQRLKASYEGYLAASRTLKNGHLPTQQRVHQAFLSIYSSIVE